MTMFWNIVISNFDYTIDLANIRVDKIAVTNAIELYNSIYSLCYKMKHSIAIPR